MVALANTGLSEERMARKVMHKAMLLVRAGALFIDVSSQMAQNSLVLSNKVYSRLLVKPSHSIYFLTTSLLVQFNLI